MRKSLQILLEIIFLSVVSLKIYAQTYNFQRPEFNDWIPPKVYCVIQDKKGYYWLGSPEGLSRIDGTTVANFGILDGLASGGIRCILEDSMGNIWYGHLNGGISRYNGHVFEKAEFDSLLITGDITNILEDNEGRLWFTTYSDGALMVELPVKDIKHVSTRQFKSKEGLNEMVFGGTITREGQLICNTAVGLRKFADAGNKFVQFKLPNLSANFLTTCMFEDSKGIIWFGTYNGGIYKYYPHENNTERVDLTSIGIESNWVTSITEDSRGRMWIGTWKGGAAVFEGDSVRIFNENNGLRAKDIYSITEDSEGNMLIVDKMNGLTIYKGDPIVSFSDEETIPGPGVYSIIQDRTGAMWFGTNKGLSRYYPESDEKPEIFNRGKNFINEEIRFIREDRDGNLWIGSTEGGVICYNIKTSKFESQPYINSKLYRGGQVKALEIDKMNNLWIGTNDGVAFGTIGEKNFIRYNFIDSVNISDIYTIYCDPMSRIWIGTEPKSNNSGLIRYEKGSFEIVRDIPQIMPKAFAVDDNGLLLIGTPNAGVFFYDIAREERSFKLPDVIRSSWVSDIKISFNNDIYIGTRVGLYIYNSTNDKLIYLSKRDGLCDNNINCIYFDHDGFAWIGTSNGVSRITTDINQFIKAAPNPIVRNIEINARLSDSDSLTDLKYNQNNISFTLGYLGFADPLTISYRAKLEGLDQEWIDYGHNSNISFPPLSPGHYTLKAITVSTIGTVSKKTLVIPFRVIPPWWKTNMSYVIYLLIIIIGVIMFFRLRERKLMSEKLALEKAVTERTAMIELQNKTLIEQKVAITDSLNYANHIQSGILPQKGLLDCLLKDYFVLFKPRDIVSGDFYWTTCIENITVIAAVDCTGHGVPGAFMSMLGSAFLNEIVNKEYITQPAVILRRLRKEVIKSLHQQGAHGEQKDGMDISLCSIDYENLRLQFSGAINPLYLIRNSNLPPVCCDTQYPSTEHILYEIKGDRMPIGYYETMDNFKLKEIDLIRGDLLYLFTDGYPDQFGGPLKKKLHYKNFKKLLIESCKMSTEEQKLYLDNSYLEWKGIHDQIDDVLIIGIRI